MFAESASAYSNPAGGTGVTAGQMVLLRLIRRLVRLIGVLWPVGVL